eukprot:scaffold5688_cov104-Cylindrotheca_fusiformis.AAC.13
MVVHHFSSAVMLITICLLSTRMSSVAGFSVGNNNNNKKNSDLIDVENNSISEEDLSKSSSSTSSMMSTSRRNLLTWPIGIGGAVVYGKLVAGSIEKLSRGDLVYPQQHECQVQDTISMALSSASSNLFLQKETPQRPLRVLEVGIGNQWRVAQRGLYQDAFQHLATNTDVIGEIELTGVDLSVPTSKDAIEQDVKRRLAEQMAGTTDSKKSINVDVQILKGSITSQLNFPDGWFDSVLCFLTLCSVDDQDAALNEIHRLVRPNGGTFGYVEHVAVNEGEPYKLLELQQRLLDPLQQVVAENCHLHRYTDSNIAKRFNILPDDPAVSSSRQLSHKRFLVNGMWPVSCQCSGVIQRQA